MNSLGERGSGWWIQNVNSFGQSLLGEEVFAHDLIQFVEGELDVKQNGLIPLGPDCQLQSPVKAEQHGIQNLYE